MGVTLRAGAARRAIAVVAVVALVLGVTGVAFAYFRSSGSGVGTVRTGTLAAPTNVSGSQVTGSATVNVSWTASTGTPPPTGYAVSRTNTSTSATVAACTATAPATTCADSSVPVGTYTYKVTAVHRTWTAVSAASAAVSVVPVKANQTISFTSTAPAAAKVGGATYAVAASATSGLAVAFSSATTSVCTVSSSTVTFVGAGTCTINADQPGNGSYNAAPQVHQSFAVAKGSQTITFTAPSGAVVGGSAALSATATSGLPVTFASATPGTCTVSGSTLSYVATGPCTVNADQPGNGSYDAAPQVPRSLTVGKGSQTITFATVPSGAAVGGTGTVGATSSSGLTVTFTSATTAACTVSGTTVSYVGVGTCTVNANQAGTTDYNAATQVTRSFPVGKGGQTITFTSTAPAAATVGGATYAVSATSSAGLTVAFGSATTAVCTVSGTTVSIVAVGTCTVNANQAGSTSYNAAAQVQQSFAVGKGSQTITFTSTAPTGAVVGGPTYDVSATATSGSGISFASATPSVCAVSNFLVVTFSGAGTCTITANQGGNTNYNAAPQAQQSFAVGKGSQTISFASTAPTDAIVGGATYAVSATATSGDPVTFASATTGVCTISAATVTFVGAGTCTVTANQGGNTNYNAAPQAQQSFNVRATQTISFTSTKPSNAVVGGPTYTVSATATSGLAVTFAVTGSACNVSGATVSFVATGTCNVVASQAGNVTYAAAPNVSQSFFVDKAAQTITFTSTAPANAVVGGAPYAVSATSSAGLPVFFSSAIPAVCTVSGSTVTFVAAGPCTLNANQPGTASTHYAAPQVQQSFTVGKGSQTITFTTTAPTAATVGGTYTVTASASSGLAVALTAGAPAVCTLSGSTVSFVGVGTCTISANQSGSGNYNAAAQVQQVVPVASFAITSKSAVPPQSSTTLSGAGGTSGAAVTAYVCSGTRTSCIGSGATGYVGTVTATVAANGTWTTTELSKPGNGTFTAQAVQTSPSATSAVFGFTNS